MEKPRLFGSDYSVYVRIVRLALQEKGVAYALSPVDIFAKDGPPADYRARQPFGKIPAFEHGDFRLYETGAIARYVDDAFVGPPLQPDDPRRRARMNQIISIADNYLYPCLVWDIYVERVSKPKKGEAADEARIAAALPKAQRCLDALADLMGDLSGDTPWLAGDALTLADLYVAPMVDYFVKADEGREIIARAPMIAAWWERMKMRESMVETETRG